MSFFSINITDRVLLTPLFIYFTSYSCYDRLYANITSIMIIHLVRGVCLRHSTYFDNKVTVWDITSSRSAVSLLSKWRLGWAEGDNLITSAKCLKVISTQLISDCGSPPKSQQNTDPSCVLLWGRRGKKRWTRRGESVGELSVQ